GERIHLAEKTIKNYVSTILNKLQVSRRAEAAAYVADRHARAEQAPVEPPRRTTEKHGERRQRGRASEHAAACPSTARRTS
ncbi:MAG TPA: LuxR C-terminal-related transcriptional regulator, partial [Nocardioidaceae bacterium]|nr:LuxR C-terminal-related transcriptional regulator [Nocardioidaceae bacterium]